MPITEKTSTSTAGWSKKSLKSDPHIDQDKAKRVEAMFTSIASKYDLNNRLHSLWMDQVWRSNTVKQAELKGDETVLDVACGTGDLAMAFYRAGARTVIGVDFTPQMLDLAKQKAEHAGHDIDYRQGDAMSLNVGDESVDVVSIAFGIRNVQDPAKAIVEFHRVLKKEGRLLILEFSTPSNPIIRFLNNIYTQRIMPITATIISGDSSGAYRYLPRSVATFSQASELADQLKKAGFNSIKQMSQSFGVCTITKAMKN